MYEIFSEFTWEIQHIGHRQIAWDIYSSIWSLYGQKKACRHEHETEKVGKNGTG